MTREEFITQFETLSEGEKQLFAKLFNEASQISGNNSAKKKQLVAYVAGTNIEQNELEKELKMNLPAHMIPRHWVIMPSLPTLPNGKLDTNALKKLKIRDVEKNKNTEKLSDSAVHLQTIWQDVLQTEEIGIHDNFFELGGDSILAIQIVSKARNQGINLSPSIFLEKQTIAEILEADVLESNQVEKINTGKLTPIQSWFFETQGNNSHWHIGLEIDILDEAVPFLKQALDHLLESNSILRSAFKQEDEFIMQVQPNAKIVYIELVQDEESVNERQLDSALQDIHNQMSLKEGKLVGAVLLRAPDPKLYLSIHHLVADPLSLVFLFEELGQHVGDLLLGKPLGSSNSEIQHYYQISETLRGLPIDDEIEFWKEQSSEPSSFFKTSNESFTENNLDSIDFFLDDRLTLKIDALVKKLDWLDTDVLMTSVINQSLGVRFKQKSITIGLEQSLRTLYMKNTENTVGWMTSYFPLNVKLNFENSAETVVRFSQLRDSVKNKGVGYGLLRYVKKVKGLDLEPQIIINYLGSQPVLKHAQLGKAKALVKGMRAPDGKINHVLEFNISIIKKSLFVNCVYVSKLISAEDIKEIINEVIKLLKNLTSDQGEKLTKAHDSKKLQDIGLDDTDLDELMNQF